MNEVKPEQRASDLQLIRDSWQTLWSGGRRQYRAIGRGALIILADRPPLPGQGYPIYWLTEAQLTAAGDVDAVQMAGKYEPFDERLKRLTIELDAQFRESAQLVQLIRASLQELSSEE